MNDNNTEEPDIISIEDRDINVEIPRFQESFTIVSKFAFIVLNIIDLLFFLSIILFSIVIFIFIFLHISVLFNFYIHDLLLKVINSSELTIYFDYIEDKFDRNILEILVSYVLLVFILADIIRYIITDQISNLYITLNNLINNKRIIDPLKSDFSKIYLIIFSAILFELFLKIFSCDEAHLIDMAYLITGTLLSGAIFLYVIYRKY